MIHQIHMPATSSTSSDQFTAPQKRCGRCGLTMAIGMFSTSSRDGLRSWCKDCGRDYNREYYARRRASNEANEPVESMKSEAATSDDEEPEVEAEAAQDLYVFANSAMPGILKVGRAKNIAQRAKQLERGHPFRIITRAACPGLGHLEQRVHVILRDKRRHGGSGREWFEASFSEVMHALACAIAGDVSID